MNLTTKLFVKLLFLGLMAPAAFHARGAEEGAPPLAKTDTPKASVQIVNALSTPSATLFINGKELYPEFPQGLYTADAPLPELKPKYKVLDPVSKLSAEFRVELEPNTNQSVVMIGDFIVPKDPALYFPGIVEDANNPKVKTTGPDDSKAKPNVLFLVFDHRPTKDAAPFRYRVLNGMPGTGLIVDTGKEGKVEVGPGTFHQLDSQKPVTTLSIIIQDKPYPVFINQQGLERNALIVFYKTPEGPAFMRAFENTKEIFKNLEEADKSEYAKPEP